MDKLVELPKYKCYKEVWALKIAEIQYHSHNKPAATIAPEESGYPNFEVNIEYLEKHNPQVGGYYVLHEDGYESYSPAQAFENGYTRA